MVSFIDALIVLSICIVGVGYTSYRKGIKVGAEAVVNHLIDEGLLELEEEDEQ